MDQFSHPQVSDRVLFEGKEYRIEAEDSRPVSVLSAIRYKLVRPGSAPIWSRGSDIQKL